MVCLEPPTEGRIALTAYFLPGLADWFLDVRRKRYLLSTRRRIQVLLTVHWVYQLQLVVLLKLLTLVLTFSKIIVGKLELFCD